MGTLCSLTLGAPAGSASSAPDGKRCVLKDDSPPVVLGIGELKITRVIERPQTIPRVVDLTRGRKTGTAVYRLDRSIHRIRKQYGFQSCEEVSCSDPERCERLRAWKRG